MAVARRKQPISSPPQKGKPKLARGADGRTANDRFREAYQKWNADQSKTQFDLVRLCNQIAGKPADAEKPYVSQPVIDQLLHDRTNAARSMFLDVLAEALGVRAVWLRLGVGDSKPEGAVLNRVRELLKSEGK